jgi:hypothetical protein
MLGLHHADVDGLIGTECFLKKGLIMSKFILFGSLFFAAVGYSAENEPTLADNNAQSVLKETTKEAPVTVAEVQKQISTNTLLVVDSAAPTCNGPNCVKYKHKGNIAPCAVPTAVGVCMTETGCDACCQKVTTRNPVSVEICAPPCPSKQEVRKNKDGSRVVYDYGRYEAVVKAKDGVVEVKYRKRLFNR